MLSGEGLVCDLTGPGRIHLQTRSRSAVLDRLVPRLPKDTGNRRPEAANREVAERGRRSSYLASTPPFAGV